MKKVSALFTDVILISWILISGVLLVNMFIALLSETFQRLVAKTLHQSSQDKELRYQKVRHITPCSHCLRTSGEVQEAAIFNTDSCQQPCG